MEFELPHESDALLLRAGVRSKMIDPDKGTAALVLYSQLKEQGVSFSFGDFLVNRGLVTRMGLEALERSLAEEGQEPVQTTWKIGDFELEELLGEGESGSVFRATQISTGRPVALKILSPTVSNDPKAIERFLNEARITARLNHPNIVRCIRVAMAEGLYYYAMEFMEGGSLRDLLKKSGGRISEKRTLEIAKQVASALGTAHQAGLVHRDIKPENILLTAQGQAMVADLGIAASRSGSLLTQDGEGAFWGTADYVAPEVIEGLGDNDPRSDLYSLGATMFEMLVGQPPFLANTPEQVLRMHLTVQPPDLLVFCPEVAQETAAVVRCLLLKKPEKRLPNADMVVKAIDQAMAPKPLPEVNVPKQPLQRRERLSDRKERRSDRNERARSRFGRSNEQGGSQRRSARPGLGDRTKDQGRSWRDRRGGKGGRAKG